jgi:uncharacterized protein
MTAVTQTPTTQSMIDPSKASLGANWKLQFADADGIPLNMLSFEVIDFGAISYKEIFQNVKTILATPLFSAALERTLGIDQTIVDRPITQADDATVAILVAINQWEPRVDVIAIDFDFRDAINGHLIVNVQLSIKNVIYGSNEPYKSKNIFETPTRVTQKPPIVDNVAGPQGPQGVKGPRGSLWFVGTTDPTTVTQLEPIHITGGAPVTGPQGPEGDEGDRASAWFKGTVDPNTAVISTSQPQVNDMYLNASNGDVWQFTVSGGSAAWRRVSKGVKQ